MALDFSALMADPAMQYGMSLLGAARSSTSPFADAQKQVYALQQQAANIQMLKAQQARMEQMTTNEKQTQLLGALGYLQNARILQNAGNINPATGQPLVPTGQLPPVPGSQYLSQFFPAGATGLTQQVQQNAAPQQPVVPQDNGQGAPGPAVPQSVQPPDVTQQPQPPAAPQIPGGVDQYGTPNSLLDSLGQVESSGNPHAIGPPIKDANGKTVNAIGKYQFIPSTVQMLADKGIQFNPMIADQARAGASQYLQMLLKQNGGDWSKTLAQYGGFKTKDPTAYVQKVLAGGAGVPVGQMAPPPAATPAGVNTTMQGTPPPAGAPAVGLSAAPIAGVPTNLQERIAAYQAALTGLGMGDKGANMAKYAETLKPQAVTSGATILGPNGAVQLPQTPLQAQQTRNETPGPNGITPAGTSQMNVQTADKMATQLGESRALLREIPNTLNALQQAKASIPSEAFSGPLAERKIAVLKMLNSIIPGLNMDEGSLANADVFRSQINQALLASVKTTGGRMSVPEMNRMESNFGSLTTNPQAMKNIIDMMESRYRNTLAQHNDISGQYNKAMGNNFHLDYSLNENPAPTGGASAAAPQVGGGQTAATTPVGGVYKGMVKLSPNWQSPQAWAKAPAAGAK